MKMYSYVIPRDYGFAPNPYFGYCTLATCKPIIRKHADIGDWIAAYGSARAFTKEKLVFIMQVKETMTFDHYWEDKRFASKKPIFNRAMYCAYGDNIYHHENGKWVQEISHHSNIDGTINYRNLEHDTQTNRVLIATEFFYFGNNAIEIPNEFTQLIAKSRNHRVQKGEGIINEFIAWIKEEYSYGIHGTPYSKKSGIFAQYRGEVK